MGSLASKRRLLRADILEGRFVVEVRHVGQPWEVIVEPDGVRTLLVVITAYPVEYQ